MPCTHRARGGADELDEEHIDFIMEQIMDSAFGNTDGCHTCSKHAGMPPWRPDYTYYHGVFRQWKPEDYQLPDKISVSEVRKQSQPMITCIWHNYNRLKAIVERHEATLQKRWDKKSKNKRREILQTAWGAMAVDHRPDVSHLRHRCSGNICRSGTLAGSKKQDHFMWPIVNLEDLCKTEPLLLLINARGRHPPSIFAFSDLKPALFGVVAGCLKIPPYLDSWNMRFVGRDGPKDYGELVSWDQDPTGVERLDRHKDVSPGEGLWILEIQDRLYRFLVDACARILHDLPLEGPQFLKSPTRPEPVLPTANRKGDSAISSLTVTRYETEYHIPAQLDIRRLQNLIASKRAEAEDTLFALREDPSFFAHKVQESYCHSSEHLLDLKGQPDPSMKSAARRDSLRAHHAGVVVMQYLQAPSLWKFLHDLVGRLAEVKERLFDNAHIGQDEDLPSELAFTFHSTILLLGFAVSHTLEDLEPRVLSSPPMSRVARIADHNGDDGIGVVTGRTALSDAELDYLWIARTISDPALRKSMGLHTCVREVERVANSPEGKSLVSPLMAEVFSDLAIVGECIHQLESFQPWAASFRYDMTRDWNNKQELMEEGFRAFPYLQPLHGFQLNAYTAKLGCEISKMRYPVDKARNKANVEEMRAAECVLDEFWFRVADEIGGRGFYNGRTWTTLEGYGIARTAAWIETPEKPKTPASGKVDPIASTSAFANGQGSPTTTKINVTEPKVKAKTRPSPKKTTKNTEKSTTNYIRKDATTDQQKAPAPKPTTPLFKVDKRAKKVFSMLFHQPSRGGTQQMGEIPWTDFLHAMHQVGFGIEKLGGSVWQFTPGPSLETGLGYTRGILVHEPHPVAKMRFWEARRCGRRLERTYGWCAGTFEGQ